MRPAEVAAISGSSGHKLEAQEVCLRAVSLLKTLINNNWNHADDPAQDGVDKENISQNQQQNPWQTTSISQNDKDFIKANIFESLDIVHAQLKDKKIA